MEAENLDVYAVLNSLSEGVILADLSGRIFFSNRAADRLLGVTEAEGLPEKWADYEGVFLPDSTLPFPAETRPVARALKGEDTDDVEMLVRNPAVPKGCLLSASGRSLKDARGATIGAAVVIRDITKLRTNERMREELSALIVHDLKSPLTTIIGESDLLIQSGVNQGDDLGALMAIREAGRRLHRMALDLLDIHLAEDGALTAEKSTTPVAALLVEVRDHMKP